MIRFSRKSVWNAKQTQFMSFTDTNAVLSSVDVLFMFSEGESPDANLELQDALVHRRGRIGHEGGKVVGQVVGTAADDFKQGLCPGHLSGHVA